MKKQRQKLAEHFRDLLNSPAPEKMTEVRPAAHHLAIDCSIPSINEIIKAIKMLKNGQNRSRPVTRGSIQSRPINNS